MVLDILLGFDFSWGYGLEMRGFLVFCVLVRFFNFWSLKVDILLFCLFMLWFLEVLVEELFWWLGFGVVVVVEYFDWDSRWGECLRCEVGGCFGERDSVFDW